jgi:hypothetical protein
MTRTERIFCANIAAFLVVAGVEMRTSGSYCQDCGLRRSVERVFWLGATVRERVRLHETAFYRLYAESVGPQGPHRWRGTGHSSWFLMSGTGVGCGHFPKALFHDSPVALLTRLRDRSRVATVLRAINLTRNSGANDRLFDAIRELHRVTSHHGAEHWWRTHEHLIRKGAARSRTT